MSTITHASMHGDHQQWKRESDMWRCDIAAWQSELAKETAELKEIEASLKLHKKALQSHAAAIRLRDLELEKHERALIEYERGETGADLIPLVQVHENEAAKHGEQSMAHERIKRHHHDLMARVAALRKAAANPV